MDVTPVMDGQTQKMADGKPLWKVGDQEVAATLGELFETRSKFESVSQRADRLAREAGEARDLLKPWEGLDAKRAREALANEERLTREIAALKTGKPTEEMDAEFKRRTERLIADHEGQLAAERTAREKAQGEVKERDALVASEVVNAGVAAAASTLANFPKGDAGEKALAEQQELAAGIWRFEAGEDGKPGRMVPRDKAGKIIFGANQEPITYREWLAGKSHLLLAGVNGGGATGGAGGSAAKQMTRSAFEALPSAQRSAFLKEGGKLTD